MPVQSVRFYKTSDFKYFATMFLDLVIDLIVMEPSHEIFLKACQLAKALLYEGNYAGKIDFLKF